MTSTGSPKELPEHRVQHLSKHLWRTRAKQAPFGSIVPTSRDETAAPPTRRRGAADHMSGSDRDEESSRAALAVGLLQMFEGVGVGDMVSVAFSPNGGASHTGGRAHRLRVEKALRELVAAEGFELVKVKAPVSPAQPASGVVNYLVQAHRRRR